MVAGFAVVNPQAAQAHFQWGCNHGSACVMTGYNGSGNKHTIIWSSTPHGVCVNLPVSFQNVGSSLVSDFGSGWDVYWYEDFNCNDFFGADKLTSPGHWSLDGTHTWLDNDVQSFIIDL